MLVRLKALRPALCGILLPLLLISCRKEQEQTFTLQVGPAQVMKFPARSAFAHYYELPGEEDVLRIILASYTLGCHEYREPEPGEVFATITLRVPVNENVEPGTYVWEGLPKKEDEPLEGEAVPEPPPPESDEKDEADVEGVEKVALPLPGYALPFVRLAQDARALPPGGTLKLTKLERQPFGRSRGRASVPRRQRRGRFHGRAHGRVFRATLPYFAGFRSGDHRDGITKRELDRRGL